MHLYKYIKNLLLKLILENEKHHPEVVLFIGALFFPEGRNRTPWYSYPKI